MITFCIIVAFLAVAVCLALGGIVAVGAMLGGAALVAAYIVIGISPFILIGFLIYWL